MQSVEGGTPRAKAERDAVMARGTADRQKENGCGSGCEGG